MTRGVVIHRETPSAIFENGHRIHAQNSKSSITKLTVGQRKRVAAVTFFPARPRLDQTAQIRAYKMDVTRSQLSANTGIPVCLVREIWQLNVFTGKGVTPLREEGNAISRGEEDNSFSLQMIYWYMTSWKDWTQRKEPMWNGELEICVTMWYDQEHNKDRMTTFETHLKNSYSCEMTKNAIFMGL